MRILVNGERRDVAGPTLAAALDQLGFASATVATAVNEDFVPAARRAEIELAAGDQVEVLAPMQGG